MPKHANGYSLSPEKRKTEKEKEKEVCHGLPLTSAVKIISVMEKHSMASKFLSRSSSLKISVEEKSVSIIKLIKVINSYSI